MSHIIERVIIMPVYSAMSKEELETVEAKVNEMITEAKKKFC